MSNNVITVAGITIKQDQDGRFCLNDFHKAAGGEAKHAPSRFTGTDGCAELVEELNREMGLASLVSQRGGSTPGTYVCKELVYAYAMWVSPKFHLHVIRTYDQVVQEQAAKAAEALAASNAQLQGMVDQVSYMTLQQYRAMSGVHWPKQMNSSLGLLLASKCKLEGLSVRKFNQNGWPTNSYPVHLLDQLADHYGLTKVRGPLELVS